MKLQNILLQDEVKRIKQILRWSDLSPLGAPPLNMMPEKEKNRSKLMDTEMVERGEDELKCGNECMSGRKNEWWDKGEDEGVRRARQ